MPIGVVHLSLTELGPSEVELRYWRDNPNAYTPRRSPLPRSPTWPPRPRPITEG